ncbi:MAG: endonuclease domain-containing protein [Cytophagales bacterium]|nr:MAG: endonuclease domain-containing protein [Cytophagales bacterium]
MDTDMFYGATPSPFAFAKELRDSMTPAEQALWVSLRMNKLNGFRFKAQHPIHTFVADFYCHAARLVIEIDGCIHDPIEQQIYNSNRTYVLQELGLQVIRFRNEEVINRLDWVLNEITRCLPGDHGTSPP